MDCFHNRFLRIGELYHQIKIQEPEVLGFLLRVLLISSRII